ncbi:MAG: hypothetical protein KA712_07990 [Myxococcales bacterium]|nr:hypothetical protein [Myxococcales bacterium]
MDPSLLVQRDHRKSKRQYRRRYLSNLNRRGGTVLQMGKPVRRKLQADSVNAVARLVVIPDANIQDLKGPLQLHDMNVIVGIG